MIFSASATGIAKPARKSTAATSPSSAAGDTRGLAPPSSISSASRSAFRSSIRMLPPNIAPRNSPPASEHAAQLNESSGEVARPMQGEGADHEVEAAVAKRDQVGIGGTRIPSRRARRRREDRRRPPARSPGGASRACDTAPICAPQIEHDAKLPSDIVETVDEAIGNFLMQEIDAVSSRAARSRCSLQARRSNRQYRRMSLLENIRQAHLEEACQVLGLDEAPHA